VELDAARSALKAAGPRSDARLAVVLRNLVRLYNATGRAEKAAEIGSSLPNR
jgi:hypothetical protein